MVKKFTADFETTTDLNDCRVWAYAICEIGNTDNFIYGNSLDEFMEWCANPKANYLLLFHNLKFDGAFILNWLIKNGYEYIKDRKDRHDKSFTTLISDMGQYYSIEVYFSVKGHKTNKVTFHDSLKLLNYKLEAIAESFELPLRKLDLDYSEYRAPGHKLTPHEVDYIRNDVTIMAMALDILYQQNFTKMTIGSNALASFKSMCPNFNKLFPQLPLDIDYDIRRSYKGGFTYLSEKYTGKETGAGLVLDINSMYPSRQKLCWLPVGRPEPFTGKYVADKMYPLYTVKLSCIFELKPEKIPSIQLKHNASFMPTEYVKSSNGEIVTLTLTNVDLELFFEQYDVQVIEWHGGWKFKKAKGIYDEYINYWTEQKIKAKKEGKKPQYILAKLALNNLYGKLATNPIARSKRPIIKNNELHYELEPTEERKPIYIPAATFITSYARRYIIETAQFIRDWSMKNKGYDAYIYSDTDSIHCLLDDNDLEQLKQYIWIDPYEIGAWDCEAHFTRGKYLRSKCYIEEVDGVIHSTIAGLPKDLAPLITFDNFNYGFTTDTFTKEDLARIDAKGKLTYVQTDGGVVLMPIPFSIK